MTDPTSLTDDAEAFRTPYRELDTIEDLQNSSDREALVLRPVGDPDQSTSLDNFGVGQNTQCEQLGNTEDLEKSISSLLEELLCPLGRPDHPLSLDNIGIEDIEQSISSHRDALGLHSVGHPDHPMFLNNLAIDLSTRYERLGNIEDLQESISLHHEALGLFPVGHPLRSTSLNNLAASLRDRYLQLGKIDDLQQSILLHREALSLCPDGHPDQSMSLNNLGVDLTTRYKQLGNIDDLDESISLHHKALSLRPLGHPSRSSSLNNLSIGLSTRYEQSGNIQDLEHSISLDRKALILLPVSQPSRSTSLNTLAVNLRTRYEQLGNIGDLEESISLHRDALSLRPVGNSARSVSLNNLSVDLSSRYKHFGQIEDLEESIVFDREALSLRPVGHPGRSTSLNNLAVDLSTRHNHLGDIEDLEQSICLQREVLVLRPVGHPGRSTCLNNLASGLKTRYLQFGKIEDLQQSISLHREALSLCPSGHPDRSMSLYNLAKCLDIQYERSGDIEDLEQSILLQHEALSLRPVGHPGRSMSLHNLALDFRIRYKLLGNIDDLEQSILLQRETLRLCPVGHPDHSMSLNNLAHGLSIRYQRSKEKQDFQEIFTCHEQAASDPTSYLEHRLSSAINWVQIARAYGHPSTLNAYTISLQLLNRSLISRADVKAQQVFLATANIPRSLASDAASAAIQAGDLELAVEFLEQGRAMLWSRIDAYKSPLEQLRQVQGGPELADKLEKLNTELERLVLLSDRTSTMDKDFLSAQVSLDARMKQYRILSEEWECVVGRIREMEGFAHFLQTPPFDDLRSAAAYGPVTLINISQYRSDAIILTSDNPPNLVTLPTFDPAELREQADRLRKYRLTSNREILKVLHYLWEDIVEPVVTRLGELGVEKNSRIWWCPTAELCALPLHAARPCGRGKGLPDRYISSYTSTLSSLIRARSNIVPLPGVPKLLVVGQPHGSLQKVGDEVEIITQYTDVVDEVLLGAEATHEAVLDGLHRHPWVHFACHGHLGDDDQPFQASFEMYNNRRLTLLELIKAKLPNAECAFLAACHSAAVDARTPDESIHLSAALQFCGFRSVIGTLWEMDDEDGPTISKEFYRYMFRDPGKVDFKDSAHALSSAIRAMRKAKLPEDRWVMFVHIGA